MSSTAINSHERRRTPSVEKATPITTRHLAIAVLICLIAVSIIVKLLRLSSRELWLDESYSVLLGLMPFKRMMQFVVNDVHPPLFYVLFWGWVHIVGYSERAVRMFSVLVSIAGVVGIFFVARKWLGLLPGAVAAALFALSPMLFVYSLEARMYMLATIITVAILSLHGTVADNEKAGWQRSLAYSILCAALYYTHYIGLFIIFGFIVDLLFSSGLRKRKLLRIGAVILLIGIFIAPWAPTMLHQSSQKMAELHELVQGRGDTNSLSYGAVRPRESLSASAAIFVKNFAAAAGAYPDKKPAVALLFGLPIALALAFVVLLAIRGDRCCRLFLILALAVTLEIVVFGTNLTRSIIPILPALFLGLARAFEVLSKKVNLQLGACFAVVVIAVYAAGFARQARLEHPRPWTNLVSEVRQGYGPRDVVVFDALYCQPLFDYYAGQAGFHPRETGFPVPVMAWWDSQSFKGWSGPVIKTDDLASFVNRMDSEPYPRTIWLVLFETRYYDPQNRLLARLSSGTQWTEINLQHGIESDQVSADSSQPRLVAIRAAGRRSQSER